MRRKNAMSSPGYRSTVQSPDENVRKRLIPAAVVTRFFAGGPGLCQTTRHQLSGKLAHAGRSARSPEKDGQDLLVESSLSNYLYKQPWSFHDFV